MGSGYNVSKFRDLYPVHLNPLNRIKIALYVDQIPDIADGQYRGFSKPDPNSDPKPVRFRHFFLLHSVVP